MRRLGKQTCVSANNKKFMNLNGPEKEEWQCLLKILVTNNKIYFGLLLQVIAPRMISLNDKQNVWNNS